MNQMHHALANAGLVPVPRPFLPVPRIVAPEPHVGGFLAELRIVRKQTHIRHPGESRGPSY